MYNSHSLGLFVTLTLHVGSVFDKAFNYVVELWLCRKGGQLHINKVGDWYSRGLLSIF